MSTYVEIVVPCDPGDNGYGIPSDRAQTAHAIEIAMLLANPEPGSLIVEHPTIARYSLSADWIYGEAKADSVRIGLATALEAPHIMNMELLPRTWVVNGTTLTVFHAANSEPRCDLYIELRLPYAPEEAVATLVNEAQTMTHLESELGGWDLEFNGLEIRVRPFDDDQYNDLYTPGSGAVPYSWVVALGRHTEGMGATVYASALPLRPPSGGFLEFYSRLVEGTRSWQGLWYAARHNILRTGWPWLISRTSVYTGWCSLPKEISWSSEAEVFAYLQSPQSLHAGWITSRQRLGGDSDQASYLDLIHDPGIDATVLRTFTATIGLVAVKVYVTRCHIEGVGSWSWLRLTHHHSGRREIES